MFISCYWQEQTRQHAVTIVAMEERLLRLTRQNRQLEQEAMYAKQTSGKWRCDRSPRKPLNTTKYCSFDPRPFTRYWRKQWFELASSKLLYNSVQEKRLEIADVVSAGKTLTCQKKLLCNFHIVCTKNSIVFVSAYFCATDLWFLTFTNELLVLKIVFCSRRINPSFDKKRKRIPKGCWNIKDLF